MVNKPIKPSDFAKEVFLSLEQASHEALPNASKKEQNELTKKFIYCFAGLLNSNPMKMDGIDD